MQHKDIAGYSYILAVIDAPTVDANVISTQQKRWEEGRERERGGGGVRGAGKRQETRQQEMEKGKRTERKRQEKQAGTKNGERVTDE